MTEKADDTFRIVQLNNATMAETKNSAEFCSFTNKLEDTRTDFVTCRELNRMWHRLPEVDRLYERFRGTLETIHLCESRYASDMFATRSTQYGGTMVASINAAVHAIHSVGHRSLDPKGLGDGPGPNAGKHGKALRVVFGVQT